MKMLWYRRKKTIVTLLDALLLLRATLPVWGAEVGPFSDANWLRLHGIPGTDGVVNATVVDDSGNLYIGGSFKLVGDVRACNVAKWDGASWSALGSGVDWT